MVINNPPSAFNFKVEFDLDEIQDNYSTFQEVSGLGTQVEPIELHEGGENVFKHTLSGKVKNPNLKLKKGIISNPAILKWINDVLMGDFSKPIKTINLTISLLNESHKPVVEWKITDAWPVKSELSAFETESDEIAVETMELAYSTVTRLNL